MRRLFGQPAPYDAGCERAHMASRSADHRKDLAERRRAAMRARLLDATLQVLAAPGPRTPVIEDVVRRAGISRGTFYQHFDSLEAARVALGQALNEAFTRDVLPVYDFLQRPWQRFAVGYRAFLVHAVQDRRWAAFVTRLDVWPRESVIPLEMDDDIRRGVAAGDFTVVDIDAAVAFLIGGLAGAIEMLRGTAAELPEPQLDALLDMALRVLGCEPELRKSACAFARAHLSEWATRRAAGG